MSGAAGTAAACITVAAWLAMAEAPRLKRIEEQRTVRGGRLAWAVPAAIVIASAVVLRPGLAVLVAVATAAAVGGMRLWRRRAADRTAAAVRARVTGCCDALTAELMAGATPADALARAAQEWDFLAPAARAATVGGAVPAELRALAMYRGAGDLRVVGGAWQVAHRTGVGLAAAMERVAAELRAAEQTRRIVAGELASARATARLVAVLPLAALAMGSGAGANPWAFLVGTPLGLGCLAGGLACGLAGLTWIEAIAADVERGR